MSSPGRGGPSSPMQASQAESSRALVAPRAVACLPADLWSGRTEARAELAGYGRCGRPAQPLLMTWPRCRLSGALNAAVAYGQAGRDGSA